MGRRDREIVRIKDSCSIKEAIGILDAKRLKSAVLTDDAAAFKGCAHIGRLRRLLISGASEEDSLASFQFPDLVAEPASKKKRCW